jgi:hypothetical protein
MMVQRSVPADCHNPAPEAVSVAFETAQVAADMSPGLGGHIVGVSSDQDPKITQQWGLHEPVDLSESLLVAVSCRTDKLVERSMPR